MQPETLCPVLRWAQKKDRVFITVMLRDIKNQQTKLTQSSIKFMGQSSNKNYQVQLQLYKQINPQQSKITKTGSNLLFELIKKQNKNWTRLNKQNKKLPYVLVDWDRWDQYSQEQQKQTKKLYSDDQNQNNNENYKKYQALDDNDDDNQFDMQGKQQNKFGDDQGFRDDNDDRPEQENEKGDNYQEDNYDRDQGGKNQSNDNGGFNDNDD